jgi:hypothetical protein
MATGDDFGFSAQSPDGRRSSLLKNPPPESMLNIPQLLSPNPVPSQNLSSRGSVTLEATPRKLKVFSGSARPGPGEVDFRHWRRAAQHVLDDPDLTENRKRDLILRSLAGTAEDCVDLDRSAQCTDLMRLLDATFGSVADGHDLLVDFYSLTQGSGQATSDFVTKLYTTLCDVVQHHGITMAEVPSTLLRQFCRGTTDEEMLLKLRLEEQNPAPNYPTLIAQVRREECRRTERKLRTRRIRSAAQRVEAQGTDSNELERLRQRVADLEASEASRLGHENVTIQAQRPLLTGSRGQAIFCFRCGEDGHVAYDCHNDPNKDLVERKRADRRNRSGNGRRLSQEATA